MHARTQYTPLTLEEQRFAESNHHLVEKFLQQRKLKLDDWYDVVIFRYLLSVKKWYQRPELHKWAFSTILRYDLRSAVGNEVRRRAMELPTVSLEEVIPGTDGLTYMETVTTDNLNYINFGEETMNIKYNVKVPERDRRRFGQKSDEAKALEAFLETNMKNMCIEYDTADEAKRKCTLLQAYRRDHKHQVIYEVFRKEKNVYVVRNKKGEKKHG